MNREKLNRKLKQFPGLKAAIRAVTNEAHITRKMRKGTSIEEYCLDANSSLLRHEIYSGDEETYDDDMVLYEEIDDYEINRRAYIFVYADGFIEVYGEQEMEGFIASYATPDRELSYIIEANATVWGLATFGWMKSFHPRNYRIRISVHKVAENFDVQEFVDALLRESEPPLVPEPLPYTINDDPRLLSPLHEMAGL